MVVWEKKRGRGKKEREIHKCVWVVCRLIYTLAGLKRSVVSLLPNLGAHTQNTAHSNLGRRAGASSGCGLLSICACLFFHFLHFPCVPSAFRFIRCIYIKDNIYMCTPRQEPTGCLHDMAAAYIPAGKSKHYTQTRTHTQQA